MIGKASALVVLTIFAVSIEISQALSMVQKYPLLVVSFDGMRADKFDEFVTQNPNSAFAQFYKNGVRAEYMEPSFPSATFPNHITLVTGLNPESHGIINNAFYDPYYNQAIRLTGTKNLYEVQWWNQSEPVWMTARKQGLKTASMMWVGSDIITRNPDLWIPYDFNYPFSYRVNDVVGFISKFKTDLTFLYFEEPDSTGHTFGPDSIEYKNKINEMDTIFRTLISKLKEEDMYNMLNIIVVSDHGMAYFNKSTNILIRDYVESGVIDYSKSLIYGVISNIYATEGNETVLYENLLKMENAKVYKKNDVPKEFAYSKNDRIAPIVLIANEGYSVTNTSAASTFGTHGYNNTLPSMRAIFLAHGPSFVSNKIIKPFRNVNIYSLICHLINIKCNPSNGTIEPFLDAIAMTSSTSKLNFSFNILYFLIILALLF